MPTQNLSKIFHPRSIAVIGASGREQSIGRILLENLQQAGFEGDVYAVNPKHSSVLGVTCYASVHDLPVAVDLAVVATPAATVPGIVRGCGERGIQGLIIVSAGFREVGAAGKAIEDQLEVEIAKFPSMRIIGPNCLGVLVPGSRLNASFANAMPVAGKIAFLSQSGALCTSILDWSLSERIGFSYFVSLGNALDVKFGDLIDYFAEDESTDSIVLYIESITEARRFMSAARAFTRTKPIVVYKAGRFAQSAQAAASHTGAMAGVDAVYEAAFQRAGIVRVYDAEDMFDCAELLARHQPPEGPRLAIVTNAGGPGVMATDALLQCGGELAELTPRSMAALEELLPAHWSHGNPVDVLGDALPERFQKAMEVVLDDNNVDAVLATLSPQTMTDPTRTAELVGAAAAKSRKPVLGVWMGGKSVEEGRQLLNLAGIATYDSPDRAVRAFTYLYSYKHNREILYETPRQVPLDKWLDERSAHEQIEKLLSQGRGTLTEAESKSLLSAYGVLSTTPLPAHTSLEAIKIARQIGYPVVMKVNSPQIIHKTEVHGVVTGVSSDEKTSRVYREIVSRARHMRPDAKVEGVTIQPMISSGEGIELIVGAKRDPIFGAVIMVGAGGVTAEVLQDRALELPPLNERLARRMLESLKIRPLLEGYRGHTPIHMNRLIETLMRISYLVADNPAILELDVNPLLVTPDGVTALDARVILNSKAGLEKPRPFSHLAIRPYPDEYVSYKTLRDGANVLLRPVQPEDEPMWLELLQRCSERSLWMRFRYLFKESTHELATRFCFIDYDRTMAIVAEVDDGSQRQLVGVGRLAADADHREAEYAVLVSDDWQGRGLGGLLTDYCLEICQSWGINRVVAETTSDNDRMKRLLANRDFDRKGNGDSHEILYQKQLRPENTALPAAQPSPASKAQTVVG
jgi:acetyltransferase